MQHLHISDEEFDFRNKTSMFCSAIPILGVILFLLLRNGFYEKYYIELTVCCCLSFFLLFTPLLISSYLTINSNFLKSESFCLLLLSISLCFFAVVPSAIYLIAGIGITSFVISAYTFFTRRKFSSTTVVFFILTVYFALWALFTVWTVERPTLFETLSVNREVFQVQDLFYHCSITQIIKNYGTPSTGLQGTPYVYYHFGSHWFFAQISKLTNFHVIRIYNIFYPLVIIPCFFKAFLTFALDIRKLLGIAIKESFLSLAILFCLFLGIPNHWYARGFYDGSTLGLESQVLSLFLMFNLASIWVFMLQKKTNLKSLTLEEKIFLVIFSPLILGCIGITKISTLFVVLGIFFFIVVILKRWNGLIGLSLLITIIISAFVYFYVVETLPFGIRVNGNEGEMSVGNFYTSMKAAGLFNPIHWFGLFFLWSYLTVIVVIVLKNKLSWKKGVNEKVLTTILLISVIASLVGLLPSFLFSFNGINAIFFVSVQMYISGCFLIALSPKISSIITSFKVLRIPSFIFSAGLILLFHLKVKSTAKEILSENLNTRVLITGNLPAKTGFSFSEDLWKIGGEYPGLQEKINEKKIYQLLNNLEQLGTDSDNKRAQTVVFVNDYVNGLPIKGTENLNCIEKTFLIPALSGYAVLNGPIYNCSIESYGASYYNYPGEKQDSSKIDVCKKAMIKGFKNVRYYTAVANNSSTIECGENR